MVRNVFQLPNIQCVGGVKGMSLMGEVVVDKYGVKFDQYINEIGLPGYWPNSMTVTVS